MSLVTRFFLGNPWKQIDNKVRTSNAKIMYRSFQCCEGKSFFQSISYQALATQSVLCMTVISTSYQWIANTLKAGVFHIAKNNIHNNTHPVVWKVFKLLQLKCFHFCIPLGICHSFDSTLVSKYCTFYMLGLSNFFSSPWQNLLVRS